MAWNTPVTVVFWAAADRLILGDVWGAGVQSQFHSSALWPWAGQAALRWLPFDVRIRVLSGDPPHGFLGEVATEQEPGG